MPGGDQSAATLEGVGRGIIVAEQCNPGPGALLGHNAANDLLVGHRGVATTVGNSGQTTWHLITIHKCGRRRRRHRLTSGTTDILTHAITYQIGGPHIFLELGVSFTHKQLANDRLTLLDVCERDR